MRSIEWNRERLLEKTRCAIYFDQGEGCIIGMWQFRFTSSCELNRRTGSPVQAHMNWRCWSVPFIWSELQIRSPYQNLQLNEIEFLKSSNQLKWTDQHVQFRWKELVNISSSDQREAFDQFQFNELTWNCHMSSDAPNTCPLRLWPHIFFMCLSRLWSSVFSYVCYVWEEGSGPCVNF